LPLAARVDLDKQRRATALSGDFLGQRLSEARPIKGMNSIKQRDRLFRFVGLQRADKMKLDIAMALFERGPFRLCLLHPILAEYTLARGGHRLDYICAEGF